MYLLLAKGYTSGKSGAKVHMYFTPGCFNMLSPREPLKAACLVRPIFFIRNTVVARDKCIIGLNEIEELTLE
jgi:hypothetical protein